MTEQALTITGLKETQTALYSYSQQLGDRVIRAALRQGANYVLKGIKEGIPVKTGLLKRRGFRVANSRIHNGKDSSSMIGLYIGLRKGKGDPFYGRFQNDGYKVGKTNVPGKQFVQRGFESRKNAAVDLIVSSAEAGAEVVKRKVGLK
jgi:hypothetical protein